MFGMYGRLLEGDKNRIGIEARTMEVFVARCRVCGYQGVLVEYELDAQRTLEMHCDTDGHRARIINAAGHDYEDTITARPKP